MTLVSILPNTCRMTRLQQAQWKLHWSCDNAKHPSPTPKCFFCRGAFALFSLLKRQAELGHGSRSLNRSLSQYSSYPKKSSVGRQSSGGGGASAVAPNSYKQRFIESPLTQKVLTVLVCFGVGAIMGDGTPQLSHIALSELVVKIDTK